VVAANNKSSKPAAAKKLKSASNSNSDPQSVISRETVEAIKALRVKELQNRLKERGLNVVGVKKLLRRRLLEAMQSEILAQKSSFTSAVEAKESIENENESTNHMQISPKKQQEPVPEQDQSPADSPVAAAPSLPEHVDATAEDPMEVEEEEEDVQALADNKLDDAALVDLTEDLSVDDYSDDAVAPSRGEESSDVSMVDAPPQQHEQPTFVQDVKAPTTKPVKAAKTSRSPLKQLVQSGVQSAIKIFSKSPTKATWSASKNKSPVYLSEHGPAADAKHQGGDECESIEEVPMSMDDQDLDKNSESEPEEAPKANELGKAGMRLLSTPAVGRGSSGLKAGTSALKSSILKAKNEARKAKLAEIRGKVSLF
jgi:hypothetical protein